MNFRTEAEMAPLVASWLAQRGCVVAREFQTDQGIADVVGCSWRSDNFAERLRGKRSLRFTGRIQVALWRSLPESGAGKSAFIEAVEPYTRLCDRARLDEVLRWLDKQGLAARQPDGTYHRCRAWYPLHEQVVAVELKLSRVGEALRQASRYREYADATYVAVPLAVARNQSARRSRDFGLCGAGLLGVDADGVEELIPPSAQSRARNEVAQTLAVERLFRMSKGSSASVA